jgi:RNA polymerase sigma-70 factor (ECF subfamily)
MGRELDERSLVERLRAGDEQAAEVFVRTFAGRMRAVARRLMGGNEAEADDVVQDAFLSAFRAIERFKGDSQLGTWLHRITVNAALMKLRTRRSRPEQHLEDLMPKFSDQGYLAKPVNDWSETADRVAEREETRQTVLRLINELPATYRDVILLRDIEELDTAETARMLEISEGAVKTRLHRARLALRELLEQRFS